MFQKYKNLFSLFSLNNENVSPNSFWVEKKRKFPKNSIGAHQGSPLNLEHKGI